MAESTILCSRNLLIKSQMVKLDGVSVQALSKRLPLTALVRPDFASIQLAGGWLL